MSISIFYIFKINQVVQELLSKIGILTLMTDWYSDLSDEAASDYLESKSELVLSVGLLCPISVYWIEVPRSIL